MWIRNLKINGLGNTKPSLHWQHPLKTLNKFFNHCFTVTSYISMVEQAGHFLYLQCENLKHKYNCNVRRKRKNAGLWTYDVTDFAFAWNPCVTVVFTATMYFTRGVMRMTGVWVTVRAFSATLPVGNTPGSVQDLRETHPVTFPTVMHCEVLLATCPRWRGMTGKAVDTESYSGWQIQTHCYIIHEQCFKPVALGKQINSFTVKCLRPGSDAELFMSRT